MRLAHNPLLGTLIRGVDCPCSQVDDREAYLKAGQWLLLPTSWFNYMDHTAMPKYVTAIIVRRMPRTDKPSLQVKMIGDGQASINVSYYINQHPDAYEGMEERYLLNHDVCLLAGEPITM